MRTDLALLDVAAGHYGRLELITESDMSFSFARRVAEIARKAVDKACSPNAEEAMTTDLSVGERTAQKLTDGSIDALLDWAPVSAEPSTPLPPHCPSSRTLLLLEYMIFEVYVAMMSLTRAY